MARRPTQHQQPESSPATARETDASNVEHGTPALALLREIKDGKIRGRALGPEARRDVIGALIMQGGSVPEIALSLGVSDRTVQRDLEALRREHGGRVTADFVMEALGQLKLNTQIRLGKLERIASDPAASHQDKIKAVRASHRTELEYIHRMQTLGALPHAISERMASRGPSALHLHQHNGLPPTLGAEDDEFALLVQGADSLERMSALAERSSNADDAAVAKRARTAAKRVKNTAAAQRGVAGAKQGSKPPKSKQPRESPRRENAPEAPGAGAPGAGAGAGAETEE
ncbi:MAG: ECF-type sigma factor [Phycisphaerales bacterium]